MYKFMDSCYMGQNWEILQTTESSEINNTSHMILFKMQNRVIMYDNKSQSKENFLEVGMC